MRKIILCFQISLLASACKQTDRPTQSFSNTVIGKDERRSVEPDPRIGYLRDGQKTCTAFAISPIDALTADHCIASEDYEKLNLEFEGRRLKIKSIERISGADVAMITVADRFEAHFIATAEDTFEGLELIATSPDPTVLIKASGGSLMPIALNPEGKNQYPGFYKHNMDTLAGYSGSPILYNGQVTAIHIGSLEDLSANIAIRLKEIESVIRRPAYIAEGCSLSRPGDCVKAISKPLTDIVQPVATVINKVIGCQIMVFNTAWTAATIDSKIKKYSAQSSGSPTIPACLREGVQEKFGIDINEIRIFSNVSIGGSNTAITAKDNIFFRTEPVFDNREEVFVLLHELEHIKQFRSKGSLQAIAEINCSYGEEWVKRPRPDLASLHDYIPLEKEAETKAVEQIDYFVQKCQITPGAATSNTGGSVQSTGTVTPPSSPDEVVTHFAKYFFAGEAPLTKTNLAEWSFLIPTNGDLIGIKRKNTDSGRTEVHILSEATNYGRFEVQTATPLDLAEDNYSFSLNSDRDLIAVKRSATTSGKVEIHVLSRGSNYKKFTYQRATGMDVTGNNVDFIFAKNHDLYAVRRTGTQSGQVELHILSASSGYMNVTRKIVRGLVESGGEYKYLLSENQDLIQIAKAEKDALTTRVRMYSASSDYNVRTISTATALGRTSNETEFAYLEATGNILAIQMSRPPERPNTYLYLLKK